MFSKMVEPKTSVSFVCQRCLQPLKLDSTFGKLGEHTLAELSRKLRLRKVTACEMRKYRHACCHTAKFYEFTW